MKENQDTYSYLLLTGHDPEDFHFRLVRRDETDLALPLWFRQFTRVSGMETYEIKTD